MVPSDRTVAAYFLGIVFSAGTAVSALACGQVGWGVGSYLFSAAMFALGLWYLVRD